MDKEPVIISLCALGIPCQYRARSFRRKIVDKYMKKYFLIPVCPEQLGGLPTPRVACSLNGNRVIGKDGKDYTKNYLRGAELALEIAKKELQDALQKKLGFSIDECNEFIKSLPIEWVPESVYAPLLDRASQFIKGVDSHFVALAMLVDGILITGDREILDIKSREVKISKLAEFIKRIVKN